MWTRPVLAPHETIDLAAAITKKNVCQAAEQIAYVKKRHPEVTEIFAFGAQGDRLYATKAIPNVEISKISRDIQVLEKHTKKTFLRKIFISFTKF